MPAIKIGDSRQVVIPKKIQDALGLAPGDYLNVELRREKIVLTPKTSGDRRIARRIAEGLEDIRRGRVYGPFSSTREMIQSLHRALRAKRKRKPK